MCNEEPAQLRTIQIKGEAYFCMSDLIMEFEREEVELVSLEFLKELVGNLQLGRQGLPMQDGYQLKQLDIKLEDENED